MNPSRIFILRPVATTLLMVAVLLCGWVSYLFLPLSALPEVDYPTIQVVTLYPGASPEVMTSTVTSPLETQFGQIPGLNKMSSSSSAGASVITLQFALDLSLDVAEQEVQAAINAATVYLPGDLPSPPIYSKVNPADTPILTLGVTSSTLPMPKVQDLVDTRIAQKISQLSGVGLVTLSGGQRPAVRVQANPTALAAYGLDMETLRSTISNANVNSAKGSFDGPSRSATIEANDQISSAVEFGALIIAYKNGAPVRIRDVADVIEGAENTRLGAWANKTPAIIVSIQRQPGANVIEVARRIEELLPELRATLPASLTITKLTDRTVSIRASVHDVTMELLLAIVLVVLIIYVFLRDIPATIIPSVAVPLSLVGTLAVMYLMGFSINNLTLMALTIATGFVVDDAIVMIENIARYIEEGMEPMEAALKGSEQIGFTIISLTISLIAVLIPLLFMGDVVGRLFHEFAITLAVAILISAGVSLTLTPMMCARLLRHVPEEEMSRFARASKKWFDDAIEHYARMLQWVLQRQGLTMFVFFATLALTAALYVFIPKGFFPQQDTGIIQAIVEAPQNVSYDAMARRQQMVAERVLENRSVESLSSYIGVDGTNATLNTGRMLINLKPHGQRPSLATVMEELRQAGGDLHDVKLYMQPVQDLTIEDKVSRTQYQLTLLDADYARLVEWVPKLIEQLRGLEHITDVTSDLQSEGLKTVIRIDRASAMRLGITAADVDNALYNAFGQRLVSTIFTQASQYRVVLEAKEDFRKDPAALAQIYVIGEAGKPVPLSAFCTISEERTPLAIGHVGQFPSATISFNLAKGHALGAAVKAIREAEKQLDMPASIQTQFEGSASAFQASLSSTLFLILAAIVTMYIVLGVLYESYIHPVTILSTLPSAAIGALLALMMSGNDLGIIAIIGIILLIGIVKKNAIMIIDFALDAERSGLQSPREAIYQACLLRFRPILMTTLAALLGALPLMLGTGVGSELRHPLGVAMVGGLLLSQLLTLFTTPVIYLAFDRLVQRMRPSARRDPDMFEAS